ncbi:MAG TPA: hypothetical protein VGB85_16320 [Nannocystis sp.]|jgi:hypothetical protein
MANFGPDMLSRFTAALAAVDRDTDALAAALKLFDRFQDLDLHKPRVAAKLPAIEHCPAGARYRLLVDCESGDPKYWMEIGSDWQVHARRDEPAPVDLAPGDVVLRPPSTAPAPPRSTAGTLAHPLRLCRAWIDECKAARQVAHRAHDLDEASRLAQLAFELADARTLLTLLAGVDVTAVERATTIPYYQCGYYDVHLAIDMASSDWSRWVEVRRDGPPCPLGEARGHEYDIFSGHLVLRPAR